MKLIFVFSALALAAQDPAALYKQQCAVCHADPATRAPSLESMSARSAEAVLTALVSGAMRVQGARLSGVERRAIAEHITGKKMAGDASGTAKGRCATNPPLGGSVAWNGWSPSSDNSRYAPTGLTAEQTPKLKLKWAFGFPDATMAWAQPSIAFGRVFVGSHNGTVFSLDAKTGCIYWTFSARGGVRTAVAIDSKAVYFGDTSSNVYALNAATGALLWTRRVETHPSSRVTGSPALHQNRLFVPLSSYEEAQGANPDYECCTFRGSLVALDTATGEVAWKTYVIPTEPAPRGKSLKGKTLYGPAGGAIWSAPTVDAKRGVVYAATGNSYTGPSQETTDAVIAFDIATGKMKWVRQATPDDAFVIGCRPGVTNPNCPEKTGPDFDFGNPPMLVNDVIYIGQKSGVGYAMDPNDKGRILWQYKAGQGSALGGMEWGSAADNKNVYFPVSDILGPKPGGLHAVDMKTGERVWYAPPADLACGAPGRGCNAALAAAISVIPGAVFAASNDGAIRAHSTKDGAVIWEFNTNREFETVNGITAKGGSIQGPGPAIAGGMVYLNSGYGAFGGRPGNVLLAFGVE
ncbi:MAG: cytochrome C oxidase Cbb3 [Acidobacteria bacterium]|nr:cytochrome C oxidase Cbb3 [Acidobacteriota bacterium]